MDSFECFVGDTVLGVIVAVLDGNGTPTTLPGTPVWGSSDLEIATPTQAPDGMSAFIETSGAGECDIYVDTGVSDTPTSLVQGRAHLTVKPKPHAGEVRTVIIDLRAA